MESVAFSPNGNLLVSGNEDGTLRRWLAYPDFAAELCKKVTSNMSHSEWENWVSRDIDYIEACPGLPVPGYA